MSDKLYTFDVYRNVERDHGEMEEYLTTKSVSSNKCVQELKTELLEICPFIYKNSPKIKFYKTKATYRKGFGLKKSKVEAPNILLESNSKYKLEEIVEKIPTTTDDDHINLEPILPYKIVLVPI